MKKLQFFAFLFFTVVTISCSSDESGDNTGGGEFVSSFELTSGGNELNIIASQGSKSGNSMAVVAADAQGNSIEFTFDKFGNLGTASFSPADFELPTFESHQNFSGYYFTFDLIEINESNKTVKASFSGKLYEDEENLNSEFTEVSGSFWINYTEVTPLVPGLEVSAKINGDDWYSTNSYTSNGIGNWSTFILNEMSDDEYKILLGFDDENMNAGTYTFTPATETIYASIEKYNLQTKMYEKFDATGTLEITGTETFGFVTVVSGTYSFSAVNPSNSSETIQVTNGNFKSVYSW